MKHRWWPNDPDLQKNMYVSLMGSCGVAIVIIVRDLLEAYGSDRKSSLIILFIVVLVMFFISRHHIIRISNGIEEVNAASIKNQKK